MEESTVAAGTYTLTVDDQASIHDFHLTGDGVDVSTDVSGTGEKSFTVTLTAGHLHVRLRSALEPDARHADGHLIS